MDLGMYRWRVKIQQSINNTWSWCWGDSALKFKHFSHIWLFMKKYLFRTHWCFPGCLYSLDLLHLCHNGTAIFFWQILCWLVFHRVLQLVWFLPQHLHFSFIIHVQCSSSMSSNVETCKALKNFWKHTMHFYLFSEEQEQDEKPPGSQEKTNGPDDKVMTWNILLYV